MVTLITMLGVGTLISVLGIINMTGNISTLHSYHRQRVTEEDRLPFGRLVGGGTLIIGIAVIIFGALMFAFEQTESEIFSIIGTIILILGIIIGSILTFYGMIKYNKGIF